MLTGRHSWQLEEAGNHLAYFPTKFKSWPEALTEKGWFVGITGKGWGPGVAKNADGKPRAIVGRAFNSRTAPPPAKGISHNDYAANFADFLDAAPKGAPWCFWYGATEPHRSYEFQVGVNKGGKKLSDVTRVPAYWPDHETVRHDLLDSAYEVEHADKAPLPHAGGTRTTGIAGKHADHCHQRSRHAVSTSERPPLCGGPPRSPRHPLARRNYEVRSSDQRLRGFH